MDSKTVIFFDVTLFTVDDAYDGKPIFNYNSSWLVGCFGYNGPLRRSGRLPLRGRKRRENPEESKMSKQSPHAPTASAICPFPTIIQIVGRLGI